MKIRNRNRNIDVQNIIISKTDSGTDILIIINDKVYKMNTSNIFSDVILKKVNEFLEGYENE